MIVAASLGFSAFSSSDQARALCPSVEQDTNEARRACASSCTRSASKLPRCADSKQRAAPLGERFVEMFEVKW